MREDEVVGAAIEDENGARLKAGKLGEDVSDGQKGRQRGKARA
jgi:hypothetical protein